MIYRSIYCWKWGIKVFFFLNFCNGVQPSNNVTMLWQFQANSEGTQPYIYMYPFSPQTPLPSRLPQNIEQSSMCCVYMTIPNSLTILSHQPTPATISLFSKCVSLLLLHGCLILPSEMLIFTLYISVLQCWVHKYLKLLYPFDELTPLFLYNDHHFSC